MDLVTNCCVCRGGVTNLKAGLAVDARAKLSNAARTGALGREIDTNTTIGSPGNVKNMFRLSVVLRQWFGAVS